MDGTLRAGICDASCKDALLIGGDVAALRRKLEMFVVEWALIVFLTIRPRPQAPANSQQKWVGPKLRRLFFQRWVARYFSSSSLEYFLLGKVCLLLSYP